MWAHEKSVETAVEVPKSEHFLNNIADGHESFKDHHWFYKTLFLFSDLELQIKLVKWATHRVRVGLRTFVGTWEDMTPYETDGC